MRLYVQHWSHEHLDVPISLQESGQRQKSAPRVEGMQQIDDPTTTTNYHLKTEMNFAPYAPPPDERRQTNMSGESSKPDSVSNRQPKPYPSNPWSSYQQGGVVVDPSRVAAYSSPYEPKTSYTQQGPSAGPGSYTRSLGQDALYNSEPSRTATTRSYLNAEAYETRLGWVSMPEKNLSISIPANPCW
jgi:hypothetical protein